MRRILLLLLMIGVFPSCEGDDGQQTLDVTGSGDVATAEDGGTDVLHAEDLEAPDDFEAPEDLVAPEDLIVPEDLVVADLPACLSGGSCDDGDPCTEDSCDPLTGCVHGPLSPDACEDGDQCTDDLCETGVGCVHVWNTVPCDDGEGCTAGDKCLAGICRGTLLETNGCAYAQVPSIPSCSPGAVTGSAKAEALAAVNQVRALSGLPPVTYDYGGDAEAQAAALIMAANGDLNHHPPQDWHCWSQAGYDGAGSSNLHMGWSSSPQDPAPPSDAVAGFLVDWNVPSLGHRRWLLDPFLPSISWGAAGGLSAIGGEWPYVWSGVLQVIKDATPDISGLDLDFVAYPVGDYPAAWFETDWYLSFSALVNTTASWNNEGVTYGQAQVSVIGSGDPLSIYDLSWNNEWFGLPNNLQWRVAGLQAGVTYTVAITGVRNGAVSLDYEYTFTLM